MICPTGVLSCPVAAWVLAQGSAGRHRLVALAGVTAVVAQATLAAGLALGSVPLELAARPVAGVACGFAVVGAPTYVNAFAPLRHRQRTASLFQVATTVGILAIVAAGYGAETAVDWARPGSAAAWLQAVLGVGHAAAAALLATGLVSAAAAPSLAAAAAAELNGDGVEPEPPPETETSAQARVPLLRPRGPDAAVNHDAPGTVTGNAPATQAPPPARLMPQLLRATALPVAQQLTGINALVSFFPIVARALGVPPLAATFGLMAFNCAASVAAMPLNARVGFRRSFLVGVVGCVAADVAMVGGLALAAEWPRRALCGAASVCFVAAFELGIGLTYYPLASRVAAAPHADRGLAWVAAVEGVLSFTTNYLYPVVVAAFPSARDGQLACFAFFAVCGGAVLPVLWHVVPRQSEYG